MHCKEIVVIRLQGWWWEGSSDRFTTPEVEVTFPGETGITAAVNSGRLLSSEQAWEFNIRAAQNKNKTKPIGDTVGCQAFAFRNELYPNHRQPLNIEQQPHAREYATSSEQSVP